MVWHEQPAECVGAVFFRGSMPPAINDFSFLALHQITIGPADIAPHEGWAVNLHHPQWGAARLSALRKPNPIPRGLLRYDNRIDDLERAEAALGQSSVGVRMTGVGDNILRDRKRLLRYLNAVMGDDGVISIDVTANRFWPRAALADELCHDADLDIESLFTMHAVSGDDKRVYWYHSHGLAEIGFFDFDVLRPAPDLMTARCNDFARAMAFNIVERKVKPSTGTVKLTSNGPIRLVDVREFDKHASKADRSLRDDPTHNQNRTVLCEPEPVKFMHRFVGTPARPSRLLSKPQNDFMVYFTPSATSLMARRARQTYSMLRDLSSELAEMRAKPIVKLGYPIDDAKPESKEHMWFEVNSFADESIDATLMNQPHWIKSMMQGDRRRHSLGRMTDWSLIVPTGMITPRDTRPVRTARRNRSLILSRLGKSTNSNS